MALIFLFAARSPLLAVAQLPVRRFDEQRDRSQHNDRWGRAGRSDPSYRSRVARHRCRHGCSSLGRRAAQCQVQSSLSAIHGNFSSARQRVQSTYFRAPTLLKQMPNEPAWMYLAFNSRRCGTMMGARSTTDSAKSSLLFALIRGLASQISLKQPSNEISRFRFSTSTTLKRRVSMRAISSSYDPTNTLHGGATKSQLTRPA